MLADFIASHFSGTFYYDLPTRLLYATDASVYKELPIGVTFPKNESEIIELVKLANAQHFTLIPRAAGTSLAGQVVGHGVVLDMSKTFDKVLEINPVEQYARIQPGVVRDEFNRQLEPFGFFFAPETATSNRCRIGGMCGNNSCGANSLLYGSTRHHILELNVILHDGSTAIFKTLNATEFEAKTHLQNTEGELYRQVFNLLQPSDIQNNIRKEYPDKNIQRRSMGYAIDELINFKPFTENGADFNFCPLIVGSEGTLTIITEIKVKLTPLPPKHRALFITEMTSMEETLDGNLTILPHKPAAIELIDKTILDLAKQNITQNKNRFFLKGDPAAILVTDLIEESEDIINQKIADIEQDLKSHNIGVAYTIVRGQNIAKVWALRKAGLGIMSNVKGDAKPVTVVEDVAVSPATYPAYYQEFKKLLQKYDLRCAFYAHISTGELHNKPIFNLKDPEQVQQFRAFAYENAVLVKKVGGSLSGEHGDGRLRGEFLSLMIGEQNYHICQEIKNIFDPEHIFNEGKIVNAPKMNEHLRYSSDFKLYTNHLDAHARTNEKYSLETMFDFSDTDGILRAIEKCNGSADCKRSALFGNAMCPSYQATLDEHFSTRARANILREFLSCSTKKHPFDHSEIKEALEYCLACKACKSECPSNVDMTKLRAEFLYQYYKQHPLPFRSFLIGHYPWFNAMAVPFHSIYNFIITNKIASYIFKKTVGFSTFRSLPTLHKFTLKKWAKKHLVEIEDPIKTVYFFNDEFTNTVDVPIGIAALSLLQSLHYQVRIVNNAFSGRTYLSKGLLKKAKRFAETNVRTFAPLINDEIPLIGLEPSAILSFKDEYKELVSNNLREKADYISEHAFLIDEFIADEFSAGNIRSEQFTEESQHILFHAHCYQKALSNPQKSIDIMQIPINYQVTEIKDSCCGMAGAFGYEKEHYDFSMKVANVTLFPTIEKASDDTIIAATGTSCRHQIHDGLHRDAKHPVEILWTALKPELKHC